MREQHKKLKKQVDSIVENINSLDQYYQIIDNREAYIKQLGFVHYSDLYWILKEKFEDQISKLRVKPSVKYNQLKKNTKYLCKLQSFNTGRFMEQLLVYVKEDDCAWRTADDNSEIDEFNWTVVEILK